MAFKKDFVEDWIDFRYAEHLARKNKIKVPGREGNGWGRMIVEKCVLEDIWRYYLPSRLISYELCI